MGEMKSRIIIFSGYNQRAVIALMRTVSALNVPRAIVASCENDTIFRTIYAKDVCVIRYDLRLEIDKFIPVFEKIRFMFDEEKLIIAPSTETLIRLFLKNQSILKKYGMVLPVVNETLYGKLSDKINFYNLCLANGICTPKKYTDLAICPELVVAKPRCYYSENTQQYLAPVIIKSNNEKEQFLRKYCETDFFYEEYVEGEGYYLLYYFFKDGNIVKFSQKNILQQAGGKSILMAEVASIHHEKISDMFEKLLHDLGFQGLIMIEVRKNRENYYMIEANPRMWGPSQLFVDAGVNFFHAFLYDWKLTEKTPKMMCMNPEAKYCWTGGIRESLLAGNGVVALSDKLISVSEWIRYVESDIYFRNDTINIFREE